MEWTRRRGSGSRDRCVFLCSRSRWIPLPTQDGLAEIDSLVVPMTRCRRASGVESWGFRATTTFGTSHFGFGSALPFALRPGLAFGMKPFRQLLASRSAIPLLVCLRRDLTIDQQLGKLPALRFALDWHVYSSSQGRAVNWSAALRSRARPAGGRRIVSCPSDICRW